MITSTLSVDAQLGRSFVSFLPRLEDRLTRAVWRYDNLSVKIVTEEV